MEGDSEFSIPGQGVSTSVASMPGVVWTCLRWVPGSVSSGRKELLSSRGGSLLLPLSLSRRVRSSALRMRGQAPPSQPCSRSCLQEPHFAPLGSFLGKQRGFRAWGSGGRRRSKEVWAGDWAQAGQAEAQGVTLWILK